MIMELTYRKEGDYLLPNVTVPESPRIGKYGMLRRDYLKNHQDPIYTNASEWEAENPFGGDRPAGDRNDGTPGHGDGKRRA